MDEGKNISLAISKKTSILQMLIYMLKHMVTWHHSQNFSDQTKHECKKM
jgi:hypothetical protein